ncbi:MAG: Cu(I)-responsive transcriptional regulator [Aquisalimonadaceae bacterium]
MNRVNASVTRRESAADLTDGQRMNIGQASKRSGVSAKMIRHYESIGLFEAAARTGSGYRVFTSADVHTLRFIRHARDLGFTVDEIRHLVALWRDESRASADVKALATRHIADLEGRIEQLQGMVRTLKHLADCCEGDHRPDCPILDDLASPHRR